MVGEASQEQVEFEALSAERARAIDAMCDCFEHQLQTGSAPAIESLIEGFAEPDRSILLRELMALDLEQRVARREALLDNEWFRRFPAHHPIVRQVLLEFRPAGEKPPAAPAEPLPDIPKYKLLRKLSEGGMGSVYLAMHTELGNLVAIKLLRRNRAENSAAEIGFWRELKVIGTLTHPHIVLARDGGTATGGVQYLVMEYLVGFDLAELVRRIPRLPVADVCEIARCIAAALAYAHQHQLVHRDIKPQNVLFGRSYGAQGDAQVKVVDFGLALLRGTFRPDEAGGGEVVGTFTFMAPEQYWDQSSDIRSDLYSLGCTLFFLLTGRPPFTRAQYPSTDALMTAHRQLPPPSLVDLRPDVDAELVELVEQLLAKAPGDRPSSPAVVVERLQPLAAGQALNALLARAEGRTAASDTEPLEASSPLQPLAAPLPNDEAAATWAWSPSTALAPLAEPPSSIEATAAYQPSNVEPVEVAASPASHFESLQRENARGHGGWAGRGRRAGLAMLAAVALLVVWQQLATQRGSVGRDLLPEVNVTNDAVGEPWQRNDASVTSPDAPFARLRLPGAPSASYRLEVEARRRSGSRLVIGLVRNAVAFPVVLDETRVASGPDATNADTAAATELAERLKFRTGPAKTYVCQVDPLGIIVAYEDRLLFALAPAATPPPLGEWQIPDHVGLFLGSHNSVYDFQRVTLYPERL